MPRQNNANHCAGCSDKSLLQTQLSHEGHPVGKIYFFPYTLSPQKFFCYTAGQWTFTGEIKSESSSIATRGVARCTATKAIFIDIPECYVVLDRWALGLVYESFTSPGLLGYAYSDLNLIAKVKSDSHW